MRLFLGIDVGAADGKVVALSEEGEVFAKFSTPVTDGAAEVADRLRLAVGAQVRGRVSLRSVVATGRGRFRVGFANRRVNEVLCQARGVVRLVPSARSLLDIGGRDARLILLNPQGEVDDFVVHADCVVGMRRLLELVGAALERDLPDLAGLRGDDSHHLEIDGSSLVCADQQVVSLLASGEPHEDIWAGIQRALAARLAGLVDSLPDEVKAEPLVLTGGIARHSGVVDELAKRCGVQAVVAPEPAFTGALGAAMIAWAGAQRGRRPSSGRRHEPPRSTKSVSRECGRAAVHCGRRLH